MAWEIFKEKFPRSKSETQNYFRVNFLMAIFEKGNIIKYISLEFGVKEAFFSLEEILFTVGTFLVNFP